MLGDYCESRDHEAYTCPYHNYIDATCASFEKGINYMTYQIIETMKMRIVEYSQSFNQIRETSSEIYSCLGSPKSDISYYEDSEPSNSTRPDLIENTLFPSLGQENDLPDSLSTDLEPCTSSPNSV